MPVTREQLSGGTDYVPIQVTGITSGAAITVHAADPALEDSIYLWAVNRDTSVQTLSLEHGAATVAATIPIELEPNVPQQVLDGLPLTNSLLLKAFASLANVISVYGYVNRVED